MKTLEIVGRGFSLCNYWKSADVTWGICLTAHALPHCDMAWWMDDIGLMAQCYEGGHDMLREFAAPIMTCKHHYFAPTSQEYPLDLILQEFGIDWLNNTVAYAIAYAIFQGYKEIHLHGIDYCSEGEIAARDDQRRCTEMWLNYAKNKHGVVVKINPLSFLFDTNTKHMAQLDPQVQVELAKAHVLHGVAARDRHFYGFLHKVPYLSFDFGYNK